MSRTTAVSTPSGWSVVDESGPGPFVCRRVYEAPGGTRAVWESRRHRKGLGLARPGRVRKPLRRFWSAPPGRQNTLIAVLFMVGAALFGLGSVPLYSDRVGAEQVGLTFFAGSVFFTAAAYLTFFQAINASRDPRGGAFGAPERPGFWSWEPRRIDWWATSVQFVGTVFFNVSTFAATLGLGLDAEERFVWAPDALGSIAFLAASAFAYAEVAHRSLGSGRGPVEWWIAVLNVLGSLAFGLAAVAAFLVPDTGEPLSVALVNAGTFAGAACFFAGAYLLVPEAAEIEEIAPSA